MTYFIIHVAENDTQAVEGPTELMGKCDAGARFEWPTSGKLRMTCAGVPYDWIPGGSWYPFVCEAVKTRIESAVGDSVQWIGPFVVQKKTYFLLNCVDVIDCVLPHSNSNQLFIDSRAVENKILFRPKGFTRRLICAESLRDDCVRHGDTGIRFGRIQDDGWEDMPF